MKETMWVLRVVVGAWLVALTGSQSSSQSQFCLSDNVSGCALTRPPVYMVLVPRRVRPNQVIQAFVTILRMEFDSEFVNVRLSIVKDNVEYTGSSLRFDRPASRIMQLQMPSNAQEGNYKLRVEGSLDREATGNIFQNETDIQFTSKQASLFIQMSQPIYRQTQRVHFRIIPIQPNLMPNYGSMTIYVLDPTGFAVRRWLGVQTNAGGLVSQHFDLSDQPNFGKWQIKVLAFGHEYREPFQVEDFWEPRFDVNVTVPPYLLENSTDVIRGVMLANQTSGRPCKGNATITVFFRPREEVWNATRGWERPYYSGLIKRTPGQGPPEYKPISEIPVMDYYMYLKYDYWFIDHYDGRIDFEYRRHQLEDLARRSGEQSSLVNSGVYFWINVTDWYSGMNRTGWAGTLLVSSAVQLKWVGEAVRTFKPMTRMKVYIAVTKADGTPVTDSNAVVTLSKRITSAGGAGVAQIPERKTATNGIVDFEIYLGPDAQSVKLEASYNNDPRTKRIEMRGTRYFSPSNSYISIETSTDHPKVNEYMIFHVKTSSFVPRIFYQVVSQGNIIIGDEIEMKSKQKTFAVALSREMVPVARIVVYYIRHSEEIVSDVLNFFVNGTRHNQVSLSINRGKDFSRDTVEFNAEAHEGSYVAFSGMLLDLYNRGLNDGITENKLINQLATFDEPANSTYRHLWRISDTEYEYKFFHGYDYGVDANTSFHSAGLLVMTDAELTRLDNAEMCEREGNYPCFTKDGSCFTEEQKCNGIFDACIDGADEHGCPQEDEGAKHLSAMDRVSRVMRFYDNSSWAWQEIFVKPDGRVDFRVDVPKYPLSWVINGLSISRDLGLGIMTRPVRYDAARYMYIQVEHPEVIRRGEQIGVRVTVFNYWYEDDYLEVLITMHGSPDYDFVIVEDLGWALSYQPRTHKGDHQTIVFLEPGESKDIYMPIVPVKSLTMGNLTFHVSATCFMERDSYTGHMTVIPDGTMNYYHIPFLIDLIRFGSMQVPDLDVPVPEQFVVPEVREHLYVPGSAKSVPSLFGDVVTPGFFEDYLNAENVLLRPYGGAEMITFNFAYNLLTLKFMKASQQLSDERLLTTLAEMNIVMQRILSYMNATDGSFHMFRDDPHPSVWLTAFVAQTLYEARFGEWERDMFIELELINKLVVFLCSRQNKTTGAWDPDKTTTAFDRKMASHEGIKTELMYADRIPLTAYVLIALFKVKDISEEALQCRDTARDLATQFLEAEVMQIDPNEVFHLAISTYALSLSRGRSLNAFNLLWSRVRNDSDGLYFADQWVPENPSDMLNNVRYLKPRTELMNDGYATQSTAYALMALIINEGPKTHRDSLMNWLNNMRNTIGGFASTQDSLVAMQALSQYTQVDPNRNVYELMVRIESTATPGWSREHNLNKTDYATLYRDSIPTVWGQVRVLTQGTGRALMQLTTTVNVEYKQLIKKTQLVDMSDEDSEPISFFQLEVDKMDWHGRNFSILEFHPCARWIYTERSLTSGLSVMEIDVPTGYVVMNDTLRDFVRSRAVPNLKRAEFYGRKVVFYFSYLDESFTCVVFRAERWFPVANATIQHRMRVYDYYEPGMHNTTQYTTHNLNLLNICYVCGSYQCPYCPNFNVATAIKATITLLCVVAGFLLQRFYLLRS